MKRHHAPSGRCRKLEDWPAADRAAWDLALAAGDLLTGEAGAGAAWAAATRHKYRRGYGRWLEFIDGISTLDVTMAPADRITPDHVRAYVAHLQCVTARYTVYTRIAELHSVAYAFCPGRDWAWLGRLKHRLKHQAAAATGHKTVVSSIRLYGAALDNLAGVDAQVGAGRPSLRQAVRYRDALMVALLAARPIRLRNLAMIDLPRHLQRSTTTYSLVFEAEETKTRRPLSFPLPVALTQPFDRYLAIYRTRLLAGRVSTRLWINQYGNAMPESGIYLRTVRTTRRLVGVQLNPHRFRDCLATTIALEDPDHVHIAAPILGHTTLRTTEMYYNQARQFDAARRYQEALLGLRRRLPAIHRRTRRGPCAP